MKLFFCLLHCACPDNSMATASSASCEWRAPMTCMRRPATAAWASPSCCRPPWSAGTTTSSWRQRCPRCRPTPRRPTPPTRPRPTRAPSLRATTRQSRGPSACSAWRAPPRPPPPPLPACACGKTTRAPRRGAIWCSRACSAPPARAWASTCGTAWTRGSRRARRRRATQRGRRAARPSCAPFPARAQRPQSPCSPSLLGQ